MLVRVTRNVDESKYGKFAVSSTFIQTKRAFGKTGGTLVKTVGEKETVKNDG